MTDMVIHFTHRIL